MNAHDIALVLETPIGNPTLPEASDWVVRERNWITTRYLALRRSVSFEVASLQARTEWLEGVLTFKLKEPDAGTIRCGCETPDLHDTVPEQCPNPMKLMWVKLK